MKIFLQSLTFAFILVLFGYTNVFAARVYMQAPESASANRTPFTILVQIDAEKKTLSGLSGMFSFPSELFEIQEISTEGSAVSVWVTHPKVSSEKFFDARTHIVFEGIMPGGFSGVRSPYYEGALPGTLFSVTLIPKNSGAGTFILDDSELHLYDRDATTVEGESDIKIIRVPTLSGREEEKKTTPTFIKNQSVSTSVTHSELINNGAWYLSVNEIESHSSVENIFVAESNESNPFLVSDYDWRNTSSVYVLLHQDRTKYIHTKIVYSDNTYTFQTIKPVDNRTPISYLSRILIGVLFLLFFFYQYGKNLLRFFSKAR